jgi:DNA-binding LytR/AlgR family response regulator
MEQRSFFLEKSLASPLEGRGRNTIITHTTSQLSKAGTELIRFEEKKDVYLWVQPEDILFVKSADHYIKSLLKHGSQKKWATRHCTIKDILAILTGNFVRLNKFYLLNCNHFLCINENEKKLYLDDGFSIPIQHRISRYMLELVKK